MLEKLKKHHIGIVIKPEQVEELEQSLGKNFTFDETQGVRACFQWNERLGLYEEYITQEGRAEKYDLGFHHICYEVEDMAKMKEIESHVKENKLGFRLTFPEKSGSKECGTIMFYKFKNLGIVEFNVKEN